MNFKNYLEKLSHHENLNREEAKDALEKIMSGQISHEQIASFLTAMTMKGESIEELTAFVQVMRENAVKVEVDTTGAVDLVGTGGDKSGTFNISTAATFVTAGAGVPMIKHGNRSASSNCGSADVLEELGAVIELGKDEVEQVFKETGMAFMYAPMFHPAMKHVMPPRRAIGFRTFFNILGPMANPAGVKRYVVGAFSKRVAENMIKILSNLDTVFAYTFNAHDGLDEVSITSQTEIFELKDQLASSAVLFDPESLGFKKAHLSNIMGGNKEINARILRNIVTGKADQPKKDIVLLNATFAIHASGKAETLEEAKEMAVHSIETGKAANVLNRFIEATNDIHQKN